MNQHDLKHEFPELEDKIHELKISNNHFKKLFDEYHDANKEIHRIESGAEATTDEVLTALRKQRLHLKDELYTMLTAN
jgi:uncharacterized protein YdcH (DUF465 family)